LSLFCRHNRFISECTICAKGTVLDPERKAGRRPRPAASGGRSATRRPTGPAVAKPSRGPYASAGPYDGREVRLERVPGGLRLASWRGGQLERVAPLVGADDLAGLLADAVTKELFAGADAAGLLDELASAGDEGPALAGAAEASNGSAAARPHASAGDGPDFGRSPGRSGELRDELRLESLPDGQLRLARWLLRPNRGWELQEAPVMLPASRYAQAVSDAARRGLLALRQPTA
jgi:hypothetical protein